MVSRFFFLSPLVTIVLTASLALCEQDLTGSDTQSNSEPSVSIEISAPVSLKLILDELCALSSNHCEGTVFAASSALPACVMRGSWREVVGQLLLGTGLNYVTSINASGQAVLIITQPTTVAEASAPPTAAATGPLVSTGNAPMSNSVDKATYDPAQDDEFESNNPSVNTVVLQRNMGTDMQANEPSEGATSSDQSFLPFPDSRGRPIPVVSQVDSGSALPASSVSPGTANPSPVFLPFPDSEGNPIAAQPAGAGYAFGPPPGRKR